MGPVPARRSEEAYLDLIDSVVRPEGRRHIEDVPVPPRAERLWNPADPVLASQVAEEDGRREAARIHVDPDPEAIVGAPVPGARIVAQRADPVPAPLLGEGHVVPERAGPFMAGAGRFGEGAGALPVRDGGPGMRPEHVVHRVELDARRQVPEACVPSGVPRGQHLPRRSVDVRPRSLRQIERAVLDQVRRLGRELESRPHADVRGGGLGSQELGVAREVPPRWHLGKRRESRRQRDARHVIVRPCREVPRDSLRPARLLAHDRCRCRTGKERDDDQKQDERFGQVA